MSRDILAVVLCVLLVAVVRARVELQCQCSIAVKEPSVWTSVLPELEDPLPEELTSCDSADAMCDIDCETSHNAFWSSSSLTNINPATNRTYGDDMCIRFDQPINATGQGLPLVTIYYGLAYWQETGLQGRTNLCCVRTDGVFSYTPCMG